MEKSIVSYVESFLRKKHFIFSENIKRSNLNQMCQKKPLWLLITIEHFCLDHNFRSKTSHVGISFTNTQSWYYVVTNQYTISKIKIEEIGDEVKYLN